MNAILDTCGLLYWVERGRNFPVPPPYGVSAISFCEIAWKHLRGHLPLPLPREAWLQCVDQLPIETLPITREQCLGAVDLDWEHGDPADRMIVALATNRKLPLITCDSRVRGFYPHCVW